MSNWRALTEAALGQAEDRNTRDDSNTSRQPSAPIAPIVPPLDPERALRDWRSGLLPLDPRSPWHDLPLGRWGVLLDDADWLFENFAGQAARDGWSAADLFGVLPGHDGWGGVADRLRGSRSLVMSADVARWRRMHSGLPDSFARGAGVMPRLLPMWRIV